MAKSPSQATVSGIYSTTNLHKGGSLKDELAGGGSVHQQSVSSIANPDKLPSST